MPRRDVVRLLLGALALAGLLAMHGFAAHGTVAAEAPASATSPTHHSAVHVTDDVTDPGDGSHSGHTMAALCLALLVGVTLAGLLRLGPARGLTLRRVWQPVRWAPYHRSSEPPDLSLLCVLRC